jgi:hypothetical protein
MRHRWHARHAGASRHDGHVQGPFPNKLSLRFALALRIEGRDGFYIAEDGHKKKKNKKKTNDNCGRKGFPYIESRCGHTVLSNRHESYSVEETLAV